MPYIEVAVPLDISAPLKVVAWPDMFSERKLHRYIKETDKKFHFLGWTKYPLKGRPILPENATYKSAEGTGNSMIKIHGARPLMPQ
jgi:hypothetical protein